MIQPCLGQFAEIVYSAVPVEVIYSMLDKLVQPLFPLEGYSAVANSKLVSAFRGKVANLPGYVAYRPATKQLILAFSGTSSLMHALHDLRTLTHRHKSGRGAVHSGFWGLYKGIKASNPELPFLVREAHGTPARIFARFGEYRKAMANTKAKMNSS